MSDDGAVARNLERNSFRGAARHQGEEYTNAPKHEDGRPPVRHKGREFTFKRLRRK